MACLNTHCLLSLLFVVIPSWVLQACKAGEYVPHKVSLKLGALDFALTVVPGKAAGHSFAVQEPQVNVDVALASENGGQ